MAPISTGDSSHKCYSNELPYQKPGIDLTLEGANLILHRHLGLGVGKSCRTVDLLNRGCNNKAYIVITTDDHEYIIRLTGVGKLWAKMKTEGEVAGILYLASKCPEIPVPKILGFCSSSELSGINAEYILMEKLSRIRLEERRRVMSP